MGGREGGAATTVETDVALLAALGSILGLVRAEKATIFATVTPLGSFLAVMGYVALTPGWMVPGANTIAVMSALGTGEGSSVNTMLAVEPTTTRIAHNCVRMFWTAAFTQLLP